MSKDNITKTGIPNFKKGTCACESIGMFNNARVLRKHEVKVSSQSRGYSRRNRSIKSRFLR